MLTSLSAPTVAKAKSLVQTASSVPQTAPSTVELNLFGKNGMGYSMDDVRNEGFDAQEDVRQQIFSAGRPSNYVNTMLMAQTYWQPYAMMDFYRREVSILATIISRSVTEIFRYGIDWKPKFAVKCADCGKEYQDKVKKCTCGCVTMLPPDETQKDYFVRPNGKSVLEEANDSGQSLKAICQTYAESQYQNNMAYMLCVTGDVVNMEDGSIDKAYPLEFNAIDPKFVKRMFDESAVPGRTTLFSPEDRSRAFDASAYPMQEMEDGTKLYPAYFRVGSNFGATGDVWHYMKDEMFCDNWFSQSQTYGIPPWLDIEDDILSYHFMEKHQLKRWQYGYVRGLLVFPGFNQQAMQELAKSIQAVLRKNDNSIPMIALPPSINGVGDQKVQFVSLTNDTASDLMAYKNDIRDRLCGRAGVPNLIVTDTENSGGLNSESQQITVFDRYLMDKYDHVDELLKWFLTFYPKITDWLLAITRPPKMDTDLEMKIKWAQYASSMKALGFPPLSQSNGIFEFPEKPLQNAISASGGMGMGMGGGMPSSFR